MSFRHLIAGSVLLAWALARGDARADRPAADLAPRSSSAARCSSAVTARSPGRSSGSRPASRPCSSRRFRSGSRCSTGSFFGKRLSTRAIVGLAARLRRRRAPRRSGRRNDRHARRPRRRGRRWHVGGRARSTRATRRFRRGRSSRPVSPSLCGRVLLLAIVAVVSGDSASFHPSQVSGESLFGVAYLIVLGSLRRAAPPTSGSCKNAPISLVATYAYVNPVVAVLIGWAFLDESFTRRSSSPARRS